MKIKHIWVKLCLLTIATVVVSFAGASVVFADGGAADGWNSGGDKTDSGWCNKDWDWDSCGAGFVRMSVDNPVALINSGNHSGYPSVRSYIQSTVVPACKKADATEFYLLALHVMSGGKPTGTFGNTRYVHQLKSVNDGGSGHIPYKAGSGAVEFSQANGNFNTAKNYAKDRVAKYPEERNKYASLLNTEWSNVTWFCWNPAWEKQEAETSFGAFSIVVSDQINNGSRNSTYPNVDSKKTWEVTSNEDKVRVTFAHKFFYYNGNKLSNNTTEKASTDWEVAITRDGKRDDTTGHVGIIDGFSFQGEFSLPGYQKVSPYTGSNGSGCPGNICAEDVGINTYDIDISNLSLGESTVVCSKISYDPKAFLWRSENSNPFTIVKRSNGHKDSTGCVKITRGAGENLEFWSNSSVEDLSKGNGKVTSANDGEASLTMNLEENDGTPIKLDFWHNLHYAGELPNVLNQDICTTYTISGDGNPSATLDDNPSMNGSQYCANKHTAASKSDSLESLGNKSESAGGSTVVVNAPQPGSTTKVCQEIKYSPKIVNMLQDKKTGEIAINGSSSGSSKACVIIKREKGVEPPEPELPDEDPFYTGEQDDLLFKDVEIQSNYRKVLLEAVSYYYRVPVDVDVSSDPARGNDHSQQDPESWFKAISRADDFTEVERVSDGRSYYIADDHNPEVTPSDVLNLTLKGKKVDIVVPDTVGDKICKGVAYHWEKRTVKTERHVHSVVCSRYGGCYNVYDNIYSYPDPATLDNYWQIEGSTCEPILKKPTVNVWNGSLSTQSGIRTTIANRYSQHGNPGYTVQNISENVSAEKNKFGSWVEYLAVAGGTVSDKPFGFGSGASLSYQGAGANSELLANSPLTIANTDSGNIGKASISPSSTYMSRLNTYIYGNETLNASPNVTVINATGDYTIDSDIIVDQSAQSIYDVKQYIIHATGSINIKSNVTRIDAWLVSDNGVVNTCSDFVDKSTQAKVTRYAASNNAECSQSLTVNGPIIANSVVLNRTAGSDPLTYTDVSKLGNNTDPRSIPGEAFNLSADTYLWAYAQASRYSSSYTEAYSRELPPRY